MGILLEDVLISDKLGKRLSGTVIEIPFQLLFIQINHNPTKESSITGDVKLVHICDNILRNKSSENHNQFVSIKTKIAVITQK